MLGTPRRKWQFFENRFSLRNLCFVNVAVSPKGNRCFFYKGAVFFLCSMQIWFSAYRKPSKVSPPSGRLPGEGVLIFVGNRLVLGIAVYGSQPAGRPASYMANVS